MSKPQTFELNGEETSGAWIGDMGELSSVEGWDPGECGFLPVPCDASRNIRSSELKQGEVKQVEVYMMVTCGRASFERRLKSVTMRRGLWSIWARCSRYIPPPKKKTGGGGGGGLTNLNFCLVHPKPPSISRVYV